ncbi:Hypothetical protein NocV09_01200220 [Nannochloropsis oceanica]
MVEDAISIKIKTLKGGGENSVDLKLTAETTVGQLKAQIASSTLQVPPEAQRLVFQGRMLNDDTKTLAQNKVKEGSCILLSIAVSASASPSPSTSICNSGSGAVAAAAPAPPLPSSATAAAPAPAPAASSAPQTAQAPIFPPPSTSTALPAHIVILRAAIAGVRTSNPPEVGATALRTLATMLGNVIANPMEEKYRQLKKNNAAFVRRVGGVSGTGAILRAAGFEESTDTWDLRPSEQGWNLLCSVKAELDSSIATLPPSLPLPAPGAGAGGLAMPPLMGGGGMGGGAGGMDPAMMQQAMGMMQNPAIRDRIMQELRATNPALAGQAEAMLSNPGAMGQMMQALQSNPQMMQQAQQAMSRGAMPGFPPPPASSTTLGGNTPASGGLDLPRPPGGTGAGAGAGAGAMGQGPQRSDAEMTEEELIQQAIERSLRDM